MRGPTRRSRASRWRRCPRGASTRPSSLPDGLARRPTIGRSSTTRDRRDQQHAATHLHAEYTIAALKARKHCFGEALRADRRRLRRHDRGAEGEGNKLSAAIVSCAPAGICFARRFRAQRQDWQAAFRHCDAPVATAGLGRPVLQSGLERRCGARSFGPRFRCAQLLLGAPKTVYARRRELKPAHGTTFRRRWTMAASKGLSRAASSCPRDFRSLRRSGAV